MVIWPVRYQGHDLFESLLKTKMCPENPICLLTLALKYNGRDSYSPVHPEHALLTQLDNPLGEAVLCQFFLLTFSSWTPEFCC